MPPAAGSGVVNLALVQMSCTPSKAENVAKALARVAEAAERLARDEIWVWRALEAYICHSGRTHPFPWVAKPTYMTVSMAAGQAETTNPRLIASVMRGQVDEREVLAILAALDNRNGKG